ncbi:MAG: putative Ig domain-containing protein [Opitutaceae bacterium]|nr:putative Ig domain-containing protein [Opitutaceae bacterium]
MVVAKAAATVTLTGLAATYNGSPKPVIAVTNPSGLKVNLLYGVAPGSATVPTNAGSYAVSATIDDSNYSGADSTKTLVIAKADQAITFAAPATKSVSDAPYALNGTASSGLVVSYASSNPLVASVVGNLVTPRAAGSVTITARQAGNENYNAAADVAQPLTVEPLLPDFTIPANSAVAIQGGSFLFGPVSLNPLSAPAVFSASVNLPSGLKIDAASGNISGVPTAGTGVTVPVTITATNAKGATSKTVNLLVQPPAPVITSAAAAAATAGQPFSYSTLATPSSGLTFAVSPSLPPAGWNSLAISASGVLTGTPVVGGTYVFTITATNATGSASLPLVVTVTLPPDAPSYSGVSNPSATAGAVFSFTPNFGTSSQPTAYALSGALPAGLSFSTAGVISGTTQTTGSFPISITATRGGLSATATLTLVVNPAANAPVAIVGGGSVRTGTVGSPFSVSVTATPEPTGFSVNPAALTDAGLAAGAFDNASKSIVISGTPMKVGTFQIPIVAQNTAGSGQPTTLVLTVNPHPEAPQVVSTPSVTARVGEPMTPFALAAKSAGADIVPPFVTFSMLGTLPTGLGFEGSTGVLSGLPAAGTTGAYKVLFAATKVGTPGATGLGLEVTINVLPPLSVPEITSNGSAAGQVGQSFTYTITATNGPTSFTAAPLPAGLSINGAVISGVPSTATGATPFKVTLAAGNVDGTGNPKELSISIAPAPATPVVTSALSATGRVGLAFGYKITASESPTSYVVLNLPAGLVLDLVSGQISGSPTQAGNFTSTIRAANAAGLGAGESLALSISPAPTATVVSSPPTATGEVGLQTSYQISATPAPISSYSVSGNLPPGFTLNSSTGLIKGSPSQSGTFSVAVTATGEGGTSLPQSVTFTIKPSALAPLITSPGTATGNVGSPFSYQIDATNGPLVTRDAVNLPPGLVVNPFTGQITGTPTTVGTTVASLVATNGVGAGPTRDLTIVIGPSLSAPVISGAISVSGQVGVSFSYGITASGTPTSYELTGAPAWMLLNTTTGVITGTPTAPGSFAVSAVARNAAGVSAPFPMTVNVAPAANTPVITSSQTASGTVGVPFVKYTIASNPQATSYLATGLPPGLSLNGTLGEITGTPTASGTFPVSISGTNSNGQGATVKVTITISPSITFGN